MEAQTPREKEMRAFIREHDRGRTTWQEIADREGIAVSTLRWWRSEIRRRDRQRIDGQHAGFVEVELDGSLVETDACGFEIALSSGRVIHVRHGFDAAELRRLLEVVDTPC